MRNSRLSETPLGPVLSMGCGLRKLRPKSRPIAREWQLANAPIPVFLEPITVSGRYDRNRRPLQHLNDGPRTYWRVLRGRVRGRSIAAIPLSFRVRLCGITLADEMIDPPRPCRRRNAQHRQQPAHCQRRKRRSAEHHAAVAADRRPSRSRPIARSMRCGDWAKQMRRKPSPAAPNATPGATATC